MKKISRLAAVLVATFLSFGAAHSNPSLGFEDLSSWSGLKPETELVKEGKQAGLWADTVTVDRVRLRAVPLGLTSNSTMSIWMYSGLATKVKVAAILVADDPATEGTDHYRALIEINWVGWRQVSLPMSAFAKQRSPLDVSATTELLFASSGYGAGVPSQETRLILDGITITSAAPAQASAGKPGEGTVPEGFETLFAFESIKDWRGLVLDSDSPHDGQHSGKWLDTPTNTRVRVRNVPKDMSNVSAVSLWVHSKAATKAKIVFVFHSDNPATEQKDYYAHSLPIDWEGWKSVSLVTKNARLSGQPAGWNAITDWTWASTGFGAGTANPQTELKFDSMKFIH